jgi:hypothetical protein
LIVLMLVVSHPSSFVRVWIDPTDLADMGEPQLGLDGNNNGSVSFDGVRWHVEPFHAPGTARLDELRIGRSLEAVVPGLAPVFGQLAMP